MTLGNVKARQKFGIIIPATRLTAIDIPDFSYIADGNGEELETLSFGFINCAGYMFRYNVSNWDMDFDFQDISGLSNFNPKEATGQAVPLTKGAVINIYMFNSNSSNTTDGILSVNVLSRVNINY